MRKIRKEVYGPPKDITRAPNWPEEVKANNLIRIKLKDGQSLEARSGEPLAVALERQGVPVPTLCRSGECGQCRVKVLSGRVFQPAGALVRNRTATSAMSMPVSPIRWRIWRLTCKYQAQDARVVWG